MEADWEFEVGREAPVIEAYWQGFVDLRAYPEKVNELAECRDRPFLVTALKRLNATDSHVWTSKVDVFEPDHYDPDELGAEAGHAEYALACYVDLLPSSPPQWESVQDVENRCRRTCEQLHSASYHGCRVDLVVRQSQYLSNKRGLAITAYITACGIDRAEANQKFADCLCAFTEAARNL